MSSSIEVTFTKSVFLNIHISCLVYITVVCCTAWTSEDSTFIFVLELDGDTVVSDRISGKADVRVDQVLQLHLFNDGCLSELVFVMLCFLLSAPGNKFLAFLKSNENAACLR